ncbi:Phosphoinositide phosphatase SAC6, partial [Sesamum alatum]
MEKADPTQKLFNRMRLWEFPDQFVVEPSDGSSAPFLAISRHDGSMNLTDDAPRITQLRVPKIWMIFGVVGTLNAQQLHDLGDESKLLPLWRQADPRFLWNNYMLEVLRDKKWDLILILFQGTRMWTRGANSDGFVANFVETEQLIQVNGYTASFIQIRGSIPLFWEQIVDLTYKPKFEITRIAEIPQVVERHFLDLRKKYGNVLVVNLVNKHGGEGLLCEKFASAMQHVASENVRYLHFDFHKMCGDTEFAWLSILYHQIQTFVFKNRYLLLNEKGEKVEGQTGVVRTNCIDCLDRTNVTQSMIARKMLESQLRRLGVFKVNETITRHPDFDKRYKILWANHGDDISIQYAGTPALKGDFVRLGKRTIQGMLKDGWSAIMRYYLNNFYDGTKQ